MPRPSSPASACTDHDLDAGPAGRLRLRVEAPAAAASALVLHFHAGSFVDGCFDAHSALRAQLRAAGAVVASLEYPQAPQHRFPRALEASHAALQWLFARRARLAAARAPLLVAGEQAGGNLAAALALMARDRRDLPLAGQVLRSPMLDPALGTPSVRRCAAGAAGCRWAAGWAQYLGSPLLADHPYAAPGSARRLAGLPPALLLHDDADPFEDETRAYGQRLAQAGVAVMHADAADLPALRRFLDMVALAAADHSRRETM